MSEKIDVAVQSYKKPELLIYTILTLKKHSGEHIDKIYINDDGSPDEQTRLYFHEKFLKEINPIKIEFRSNTERMGWWYSPIKDLAPKYKKNSRYYLKILKHLIKSKRFYAERSNCRYQWAIDNTNKKFLYIIHDDIEFYGDIVGLYLQKASELKRPGAVGDLGQCWRCTYSNSGCTPEKILNNFRPSTFWPDDPNSLKNRWPCRINEWSLLISTEAAKEIESKDGVLLGNYDNDGDIGAFWFSRLLAREFEFSDPLPTPEARKKYYLHADGKSGHSAWVDQGLGIMKYDGDRAKQLIMNNFGLSL